MAKYQTNESINANTDAVFFFLGLHKYIYISIYEACKSLEVISLMAADVA